MDLFERDYKISIALQEKELLVIKCTLYDQFHKLILTQDISLINPKILAAEIQVLRAPNVECQQILQLPEKLAGLSIDKGFSKAVFKRIGGSMGCINLVNMVLVSAPLVINASWIYYAKTNNLTTEEFREMEHQAMLGFCLGYPK